MADPRPPKQGPFGEYLFPDATEAMKVDFMVRYETKATMDEVIAFYRKHYEGKKYLVINEEEDKTTGRTFVIAANSRFEGGNFSVITVMDDPEARRKKKRVIPRWILVMGR